MNIENHNLSYVGIPYFLYVHAMACLLFIEITECGGDIVSELDTSLCLQGSDMNTTGAVTIEERRLKVMDTCNCTLPCCYIICHYKQHI